MTYDPATFTAAAVAEVAKHDARVPEQRTGDERAWVFGDESAARFVAATSWPWERKENRDAWALRLMSDPAMLAVESEAARERLESAIAHLNTLADRRGREAG